MYNNIDDVLTPLDQAMITGYFSATGIKDDGKKHSVRQTLERDLKKLNKIAKQYIGQLPKPANDSAEEKAAYDSQVKAIQDATKTVKRDYLARKEAKILYEDGNIARSVIQSQGENASAWNILVAEKARSHILYHEHMRGYGSAIIFEIPEELKSSGGADLPRETVRSDALYSMMYSIFSDTGFVEDQALSESELAIKKRLESDKEEFKALLNDPRTFLERVAQTIQQETLEPKLKDPELVDDEFFEQKKRQDEREKDRQQDRNEESTAEPEQDDEFDPESEPMDDDLELADEDASDADQDITNVIIDENAEEADADAEKKEALAKAFKKDFDKGKALDAPKEAKKPEYKVYTREFDEEVKAATLVDSPQEIERLYDALLKNCAKRPEGWREPNIKRALATKVKGTFQRRLENGPYIDPSALNSVVVSGVKGHPPPVDIHMAWNEVIEPDTCVTLLLDNSGSMRGAPMAYLAQFTEIVGGILARNNVPFEILGFTTTRWKGGQAQEAWNAAGREPLPGRLNDLRHIVYKAQNEPWKRARKSLGVLMKDGILKENIDGEALEWAHKRVMRQTQSRKIIIPVSDGAPIDDSTLSVNPPNILVDHMHEIIKQIEKSGVELHAIGIGGHNTSRFYRNNYSMNNSENPYIAVAEILESIASYSGHNANRIRARLRYQRSHDAHSGREYGRGEARVHYE